MKKIVFALITFAVMFFSCSEKEKISNKSDQKDSLLTKTKIEEFLAKKGTLFIKDFYQMGNLTSDTRIFGKLEFRAIVIYKPDSKADSIKGMKVEVFAKEYYVYSSYDKSETAFLDLEELQELSNAIQYMIKLVDKWNEIKQEYTEVTYQTVGNFQLVLFPQKQEKEGTEKLFLVVQAGYSKIGCYFEKDIPLALKTIKEKIDNGIKKLNNKS